MSEEIKRYRFKGAAGEYVYSADYDAAQSELAALREELAAEKKWYDQEIDETQKHRAAAELRLADAELRNSAMVGLLHRALAVIRDEGWNELEADICAAINKPEEAKS